MKHHTEAKTMIIMTGLQGSGKSTFYRMFLVDRYVRVNLDTLKTRKREAALIAECFSEGKSFAVDNTNPTAAERARYIIPAKEAGWRIIGYYITAGVSECLKRNSGREGKARVPDVAIYSTAKKLEIPSYDEGYDELYTVDNDGINMTIKPYPKKNT